MPDPLKILEPLQDLLLEEIKYRQKWVQKPFEDQVLDGLEKRRPTSLVLLHNLFQEFLESQAQTVEPTVLVRASTLGAMLAGGGLSCYLPLSTRYGSHFINCSSHSTCFYAFRAANQ